MFLQKRTVITLLALFCGVIGAESAFTPGKWASWPAGGPAVTISAAGWSFGGGNGHIGFALPVNGKALQEISFEYRSLEADGGAVLEFHVLEASGESFYCRFKPEKEWRKLVVQPEKLRIFPYGGSKIIDGKLDLTKVKRIRWNGKFRDNRFEVRNFNISYAASQETQKSQTENISKVYPVTELAPAAVGRLPFVDVGGRFFTWLPTGR